MFPILGKRREKNLSSSSHIKHGRFFTFSLIISLSFLAAPQVGAQESLSATELEAQLSQLKAEPYVQATLKNIRSRRAAKFFTDSMLPWATRLVTIPGAGRLAKWAIDKWEQRSEDRMLDNSKSLEPVLLRTLAGDPSYWKSGRSRTVRDLQVYDPTTTPEGDFKDKLEDAECSSQANAPAYQTGVKQAFDGRFQLSTAAAIADQGLACKSFLDDAETTGTLESAQAYACCYYGFQRGREPAKAALKEMHSKGFSVVKAGGEENRCVAEMVQAFLFRKNTCNGACHAMNKEVPIVFAGCFAAGFQEADSFCQNNQEFGQLFGELATRLFEGSEKACDHDSYEKVLPEGRAVASAKGSSRPSPASSPSGEAVLTAE